MIVCKK